jgi:hypothetical protein
VIPNNPTQIDESNAELYSEWTKMGRKFASYETVDLAGSLELAFTLRELVTDHLMPPRWPLPELEYRPVVSYKIIIASVDLNCISDYSPL